MSSRCARNELFIISVFSEWIETEMSEKQSENTLGGVIRGKTKSGKYNQRN